jgi:DNA-binding HxlR family transcriptional regulator
MNTRTTRRGHSTRAQTESRMTDHTFCPVYEAINLLQEKWSLHIVRALLGGPKGFNELKRDIGNCNPATLSDRLELLERVGIVSKTIHSMMPPRTSYELTSAGIELQGVIDAIDAWARTHLPEKEHELLEAR